MKTTKRTTDLHASYQAMVDNVEEFVVKEGKTLQQAFHAAEEKLVNAKDSSKEKIQQASKDLKNNLRLWGEAVEGATDAYKAQIQFDLAYVNHSIWEKLKSAANSNTAEFIEFTRTLNEKAQTVVSAEHLTAHQEHTQWGSEHALWLDEVEFWKKDHELALTKLAKIEKAFQQQSASLVEHAQAIQAHAETDHQHEEVLKNAEQDPTSQVFEEADEKETTKHKKQQKMHAKQAKLHDKFKSHHFKTMAMINMLYKEIQKAE